MRINNFKFYILSCTILALSANKIHADTLAQTIESYNNGTSITAQYNVTGDVITTDPYGQGPGTNQYKAGPQITRSGEQELTFIIDASNAPTATIRGIAGVDGNENNYQNGAPFMYVNNVGSFNVDANNYNVTTQGGWSNLTSTGAGQNYAALGAIYGGLVIQNSVFSGSKNLRDIDQENGVTSTVPGNNGGAITIQEEGYLAINKSLFYDNYSRLYGGAIDADAKNSGIDKIVDSYFIKNEADVHGGAIDLHGVARTIKGSVFANNYSPIGGAIYIHNGAYIGYSNASDQSDNGISNVTFSGNQAGVGGAIYQELNTTNDTKLTNIQNSTFTKNIVIGSSDEKDGAGSAIRVGGELSTNNTKFVENQVKTVTLNGTTTTALGGTVYVDTNGEYASTNDTFTGNTSDSNAGAIYNAGTATVEGTTFDGNKATKDGGAIYNKGTLTLKGDGITFKNNTANGLGNDIYNDTAGIVNIEDAKDDIDLDDESIYNKQAEGLTKATIPHTMFTDTGDIVNLGIMNIKNSELQLHNGINTNSKLSTKKQGTVNIDGSRIDLGGAGINGAGIIYGDKVNVNDGSTIQTHVGATSGDNGKLSANTINISGTNTALKMFVKYADKDAWNDGKGRVYTVLDSSTISGNFNDYTNALFNVESLDNGKYAICPTGQTYNKTTGNCDCPSNKPNKYNGQCYNDCSNGYTFSAGQCICPSGNEYNGQCYAACTGDYVFSAGQCVCPSSKPNEYNGQCYAACTGDYVFSAGQCVCPSSKPNEYNGQCYAACTGDYVFSAGQCVCPSSKPNEYNGQCYAACTGGQEFVNGTCVCPSDRPNYYNGQCYAACTGDYVFSAGQCICPSNKPNEYNGQCFAACTGNYVFNAGQCVCPSNKPNEYNGQCYAACSNGKEFVNGTCVCPNEKPNEYNGQCYAACGENQVFNAGKCDCAPGYERLNDGTCFKKSTYSCVGLGCDANEESTFDGWINGPSMPLGTEAAEVQEELFDAAQAGRGEELRTALDGLAPDVSPLVQTHATEITRRLSSIVSERFYNSMERTGYVHRDKRFYRFPRKDSNLWVEGMYGRSQYNVRKGWDMDTTGLAVGFDGHVNDAVKLGVSYAYTKADGDSVGRETEIDSHTGMVYGSYNPNRFYTNWLAMYTRSQYDENKKVFNHEVKADYDVDSIAAQVMFGRKMGPYVNSDWATGVIKPEIGARYIYTKQHGYTDSLGQKVGSADGHTLTGILGAQYTIGYTISPTLSWYPELRAALTYDFIEPDTEMRVDLPNQYHYNVKTENMDRFGIEVGARVGLDINRKAEVSLEYEGLFKGDYKNHTGLANLKYKF